MNANLEAPEADAIISLWQIDLSDITGENGWFYFCNNLNFKKEPFVIFGGRKYYSLPVDQNEFGKSVSGVSPRPKLTLGNVEGMYTSIITMFDSLIGADILRFIVPVNALDSENFVNNTNENANPEEYIVQRYIVQGVSDFSTHGEITLSWLTDIEGVTAPTKPMLAYVCAWDYRDIGCGYKGGAVADMNDIATNDNEKDQCSKSLRGCVARWGDNAELPALMFLGIDKL